MALIGYTRVSTTDQNLEPQVDALKSAGCETVFEDVISGAKAERPGLNDALAFLRSGEAHTGRIEYRHNAWQKGWTKAWRPHQKVCSTNYSKGEHLANLFIFPLSGGPDVQWSCNFGLQASWRSMSLAPLRNSNVG